MTYYIDQLETKITAAQISYCESDCYMPFHSGDWENNNYRFGNAATDILDANYLVKFPIDMWSDTSYVIPSASEGWYIDGNYIIKIGEWYDSTHIDADFIIPGNQDDSADANTFLRYTGNRRYVTRLRFKERDQYGVIYYKLEYLIPESQVWQLFTVVDARINNEVAPVWSPIRQNPCYANIYRSGETIDIDVNGVWTTEVRMIIYSTEDAFNRTGTVEFGVYEDIVTNYVDAVNTGWKNEFADQTTGDYFVAATFVAGWWAEDPVVDSTATYLVDDVKIHFVPNHNVDEFYTVNAVKVHFYPAYNDAEADFSVHIKDPYEDSSFYLDAWNRGYEDATCYLPVIYSGIIDATTFLRIPEFLDATTFIPVPDCVDATTYVGSWPPYEETNFFLPTPEYLDALFNIGVYDFVDATTFIPVYDFVDAEYIAALYNEDSTSVDTYIGILGHELTSGSFYLDTMPSAMEVGDFIIPIDKPYVDSTSYITTEGIGFIDSTSSIHTAIGVYSEEISGSYNIGKTVDATCSGSFNISSGTISSEEISGSYNIRGVIANHSLAVTILDDKEAKALKALGILSTGRYKDEIT